MGQSQGDPGQAPRVLWHRSQAYSHRTVCLSSLYDGHALQKVRLSSGPILSFGSKVNVHQKIPKVVGLRPS